MKKLLLFFSLLLALLPLSAAAETKTATATINFADDLFPGATSNVTLSNKSYEKGAFKITFSKGESSNDPLFHSKDKQIRFYAPGTNKTTGNIMSVESTAENITISSVTTTNVNVTPNVDVNFESNNGTFSLTNKGLQMRFNALTITYEEFINNDPAGMPAVTINGVQIEDGCFYEISKGSTAEVSAENASSITANDSLVENGEFTINEEGVYTIATDNNGNGGKEISFFATITNPESTSIQSKAWVLVNSIEDITDDGQYIIVNTDNGKAIATDSNGNNRKQTEVTIVDNEIESLPAKAMIFNITKNGNYYEWYTTNYEGTKGYLQGVANNNYLIIVATSGTDTKTSITFDQNNAKIEFVNCKSGSTLRKIGYNKSSNLFSAYISNQSDTNLPVQIYKYSDGKSKTEYTYTTNEYLELPTFEQNVVGKSLTFSCSHKGAAIEAKFYAAPVANAKQTKTTLTEGDDWKTLDYGEFHHGELTKDIIVEARAFRTNVAGTRVESPIHAIKIAANGQTTGIEGVAAEVEEAAELYNLQGVRVDRATAAPGLYIERRGAKTAKVIL